MRLFLVDEIDERFGATRNDQIHIAIEREKLQHVGAGLKQIDGIQRHAREAAKAFAPNGNERFV